jgi:hypothetical protein
MQQHKDKLKIINMSEIPIGSILAHKQYVSCIENETIVVPKTPLKTNCLMLASSIVYVVCTRVDDETCIVYYFVEEQSKLTTKTFILSSCFNS